VCVNRMQVAQDRDKLRALVQTVSMFLAAEMIVRIDTVRYLWVIPRKKLTVPIGEVRCFPLPVWTPWRRERIQAGLERGKPSTPDSHFMQFV